MDLNHYFLLMNGYIVMHSAKLLELVNNYNDNFGADENMLNYMTVYSNLQNNNSYEKIIYVNAIKNSLTIQKIFFTY